MNGHTPSATARALVARSRRPAARAAAATLRLAGGTAFAAQNRPAPGSAPTARPAPAPPIALRAPASRASAAAPRTPATGTQAPATRAPAPPATRTPPGQPVRHLAVIDRAQARPRSSGSAEPPAGQAAAAPPVAPVPAADTDRPPRHHAMRGSVPPAAMAGPPARDRIPPAEPGRLTPVTGATPFTERARRSAPSAAGPGTGAVSPAVPPSPEPAPVPWPAPEPAPAASGPLAAPRAVPAHPPVTIGEIHVHVTEPAAAGDDPLGLLAPYAGGLTARRDGVR
jgi:hypothetical protein